jgi:hypothetical protein
MDLSIKTSTYTGDNQTWLASAHGTDDGVGITLDISAFTKATHYPNGHLLSGIAIGKITATGLYGPYTPAAADGTDVLAGHILTTVRTDGVTDPGGVLFQHGTVVLANVPANTIDANGKADVAGSIRYI